MFCFLFLQAAHCKLSFTDVWNVAKQWHFYCPLLHIRMDVNEESIMIPSCQFAHLSAFSFSSTTEPIWAKFRGMVPWDPRISQSLSCPKIAPPCLAISTTDFIVSVLNGSVLVITFVFVCLPSTLRARPQKRIMQTSPLTRTCSFLAYIWSRQHRSFFNRSLLFIYVWSPWNWNLNHKK